MAFSEFLAMGGYGFYVWTSYGIATLVFIFNIAVPVFKRKQFFKQQTRKAKRNN